MKKLVFVLATIIFLLIVVSGFLGYQLNSIQNLNSELRNQNSDLFNQNSELLNINSELEDHLNKVTNQASITRFSIVGFTPSMGFVIYESNVYVKIRNFGINDIEGLTLVIVCFGDEKLAETVQIDTFRAGEEQEIYTHAYWIYGSDGTSVATPKLDHMILDEYILPYSQAYSRTAG